MEDVGQLRRVADRQVLDVDLSGVRPVRSWARLDNLGALHSKIVSRALKMKLDARTSCSTSAYSLMRSTATAKERLA